MKFIVPSMAACAVLLAACADSPVQPTTARVATASPAVAAGGSKRVVEFNGAVRKDFAARVAALGGTVDFVSETGGFAGVSGLTAEAASTLERQAGVGSVYDDYVVQLTTPTTIGNVVSEEVSTNSVNNPAAALGFGFQWNMRAIGANVAWAAGNLGSPNVTAAILDSGMDYDSPDMNGMIDLGRSASFVPSDNAIINAFFPGRNPIDDLNSHGTNVATQAASAGAFFAGVTSKTRLMAVKVLGQSGNGSIAGFLAGLIWAADHGADVANMSLGIPGFVDKAGSKGLIGLQNRVFNYANRAGMVIVVGAGNDALNMDNVGRGFSAYCEAPHVVCVSATGPTASADPFRGPWANVDAGAPYSNTGRKTVTVSAPGGTAAGWVSSICARHTAIAVGAAFAFPCNAPPGSFFVLGAAGTSQAAPHVTGLVAQLIAKYGKGNPSQIKQLLLNSLDDLGPPGPDDVYGAGRINVVKALSQ